MRYPFFTKGGRFPYTNFNNVNLDWMLKQLKKIDDIAEIDSEALKKAAEAAEAATEAAATATAAAQTATATAEAARQTAQGALDTAEGIADTADSALSAAQAAQTTAGNAQTAADNALLKTLTSVSFVENQTGRTAAEKLRARQNIGQETLNTGFQNSLNSHTSAIQELNTLTTYSDQLTAQVSTSLWLPRLQKLGGLCFLSLSVNITQNLAANVYTTICTIPNACRPSQNWTAVVSVGSGANVTNAQLLVNAAGQVRIAPFTAYTYSSGEGLPVRGMMCYPV